MWRDPTYPRYKRNLDHEFDLGGYTVNELDLILYSSKVGDPYSLHLHGPRDTFDVRDTDKAQVSGYIIRADEAPYPSKRDISKRINTSMKSVVGRIMNVLRGSKCEKPAYDFSMPRKELRRLLDEGVISEPIPLDPCTDEEHIHCEAPRPVDMTLAAEISRIYAIGESDQRTLLHPSDNKSGDGCSQ